MDIRVCVTVIRTVACNCYLEIMIVYDSARVCVVPGPGVRMGACGKLACVGFVPATVLVCQIALWLRA